MSIILMVISPVPVFPPVRPPKSEAFIISLYVSVVF